MLEFWHSARCTRQIRLSVCIAVCAVIYYCSSIQQLPALFAGLSLAIGMALHLLRRVDLKLGMKILIDAPFRLFFLFFP